MNIKNRTPLIEVDKLTKVFDGETRAVDNVDLKIFKNDFTVITGKNGSGKTVLMKHLNGLFRPTSGSIRLSGKNVFSNLTHTRTKIGLVFQDADSQLIGQTVEADAAFGLENLKRPYHEIKKETKKVMEKLGLSELKARNPHTLSGGEKRRLALAGVLVMGPEVIVLDEPFSNLDNDGVCTVLRLLLELHNEGHTIIVITQDLEKVLAHANRLIIMQNGKITADGPPEALIDKLAGSGLRAPWGKNRSIKSYTWLTP